METEELERIFEALLFVSEGPASAEELCAAVPDVDPATAREVLEAFIERFNGSHPVLRIVAVAGGYQMRTRAEYAPHVQRYLRRVKRVRLSRAALEVLAIVAYKQPISTPEIDRIRGTRSMGVLKTLLEKGLLRILGRQDLPGRPILYGTSARFLEQFGLKDLSSLPTLEELKELFAEPGEAVVADDGGSSSAE